MDAEAHRWTGRTFIHPALDYLLIGGLLSLPVLYLVAAPLKEAAAPILPFLFFFTTMAHFSSSTVRLYLKPASFETDPFLTMAAPLLGFAAVSLAVLFADTLGRPLNALYLSWSPFHYSMQAYGLAVMYAHRSGVPPAADEARAIKACALLPFAATLLTPLPSDAGLGLFVPPGFAAEHAGFYAAYTGTRYALGAASLALPLALFLLRWARTRSPYPLIIPLLLFVNAFWLHLSWGADAGFWLWVTVFHGLQYLPIVTLFHAREAAARPGDRSPVPVHALKFYGWTLLLTYALWRCWPYGYQFLGMGYLESMILVVAGIAIHHFIVDAYIWGVRRDAAIQKAVAG